MERSEPWWANDPEIAAIRRRAEEELEQAHREPMLPDVPDPVVQDFYSGASLQELAAARDDMERARARYANAVRSARAVELSWGEIGQVLGVSRQVLHRRFSSAPSAEELWRRRGGGPLFPQPSSCVDAPQTAHLFGSRHRRQMTH